jgi:hypothetical protein
MGTCYAEGLGDCEGVIEDEHFVSHSLQKMFGLATVQGFAWQDELQSKQLWAGSYAHSRMLCRNHHDELDGLDGNALSYFRNLMLILGQMHISTGIVGRIDEIKLLIDGRALERWFMKMICGAIAAKAIAGVTEIPRAWIDGLFERTAWPDEWAIYTFSGTGVTRKEDAAFQMQFHWSSDHRLNGLVINAFATTTLFSIAPPDDLPSTAIRRPSRLKFLIQRPDGSGVLVGLPAGQSVGFRIAWPI